MYGMIGTWRMAREGIELGVKQLIEGIDSGDAVETAIREVENFPYYKSVGYGGLPNEDLIVQLDAGFMDGTTFNVGAVCAIEDFANPISIAKKLSSLPVNNILSGQGAAKYAREQGFEEKEMLTERAKAFYRKRKKEMDPTLKPYNGHDTVGMVALDLNGRMTAATSTSGLFMKKSGRVGDSPLCGSGFYADSMYGAAVATGLGEDLMKGCISYEVVRGMKEGLSAQAACERAVHALDEELKKRRGEAGDLSVVAMDAKGNFGCATNIQGFSFCVANETTPLAVYLVEPHEDGHCTFQEASQAWMDAYITSRMAPVEE